MPAPLVAECLPHGTVVRLLAHGVMLNLFPGNLVEGGPANLWLRRIDVTPLEAAPLLGPRSPLAPVVPTAGAAWEARGAWQGAEVIVQLRVADRLAALCWHVQVENRAASAATFDLIWVQDVGLAPLPTLRLNEYYVSHYVDLQPLAHPVRGTVIAARQNQPVQGRHPWLLAGSLGRAVSHATDALQVWGLEARESGLPAAVARGLPGQRLQHEHALVALQDAPHTLGPGGVARCGMFLVALADHPEATSAADLAWVDAVAALPEAQPAWPRSPVAAGGVAVSLRPQAVPVPPSSLFARAPWLATRDLDAAALTAAFPGPWRHEESDGDATRLSFFHGDHAHVVLRAKELRALRPHGHILRGGLHRVPDETALTSTVWMGGVFHSMLTQGHVGINRCLSTVRGQHGLFRSQGQRLFVDAGSGWRQLGLPSAFEMTPDACRWLYAHDGGLIEVRSASVSAPRPCMTLELRVLQGAPLRVRATHHVSLGGDDGLPGTPRPRLRRRGRALHVGVPAGGALASRFPQGGFVIEPLDDGVPMAAGNDAGLWLDARSRREPWVCVGSGEPVLRWGLVLRVELVDAAAAPAGPPPEPLRLPRWELPATTSAEAAAPITELADAQGWFLHNALVHYLAPRGLEQFSGGGWGTRDVCQGPLELLLALGDAASARDLLCRTWAAQDASGDWPQWFMFFERERALRAGDSHGDIVYWPLVALARYLLASGDAALLQLPLPYHDAPAEPLWRHVQRALAVADARRIAGTALAAYGHGDWNDSLQPADPALREHLCSAWTVTLHHQALHTLACALRGIGHDVEAAALQQRADAVRADFVRHLVVDDTVPGYLLAEPGRAPELLLHPRDTRTGLHHSLLPMMHAVLEDLLTPAQAALQAELIERHLLGPDGARLFDRPLPYRGGPMRLFQRGESSAYFGREIGLMYMHAHLRWCEMLAHLGQAERLAAALPLAHAVGLRARLPQADVRQSNCYYSSSDAAVADRHEAERDYARILSGDKPLCGGWRVYSSGPGLAIALIVTRWLGVRREHDALVLDPVLPRSLDGLVVTVPIEGTDVEIAYRLGGVAGPTQVAIDGQPLPFERRANPYRLGAAAVPMAVLRERLAAGARRLVVQTG